MMNLLLYTKVSTPDQEPVKLCGEESPGVIVTDSNTVTLDYHTDEDGLSRGWSLDYSTHSERPHLHNNVSPKHARVSIAF